jgi:hypothetical protein
MWGHYERVHPRFLHSILTEGKIQVTGERLAVNIIDDLKDRVDRCRLNGRIRLGLSGSYGPSRLNTAILYNVFLDFNSSINWGFVRRSP